MGRAAAFFERYLDAVHRRPGPALCVALALTGAAVVAATKIELRTDFRELLPRRAQSIADLERIERRAGGTGTLAVAVESDDPGANARFLGDLAAALRRLPPDLVRWVDHHVRAERDFFERNKLLYVDYDDLVTFRERLRAKIAEERRKHNPLDLGLEPAARAPSAPPLDLEAYKKKYERKVRELDRFPGGLYSGENGRLAALFVRVPGSATGVEGGMRVIAAVQAQVDGLGPARYHPTMKVGFTGDVRTGVEEHEAVKEDLVVVSVVCIGLVLVVIFLFFLNLRSLFVLGLPMLMGVAWTFGLTALTIGFLNASTMFLASIVAGNGVNFGIILLARYFEERRAGAEVRAALSLAARHTAKATMVAALAAGVAYGSLLVTDFRGFNQFGFIGGVGMVLCWLATFLVMPPLLVASERLRPFVRRAVRRPRWSPFAAAFAGVATRFPRAVLAGGLLTFGAAAALGGWFLAGDPFLYNFRYLRNVQSRDSGAGALAARVDKVLAGGPGAPAGMILLADRVDQVEEIRKALVEKRDSYPRGQEPIGEVGTIFSLLPRDQERKIAVLDATRELIVRRALKWLTPAQRADLARFTPPEGLRPVTPADLPEKMARPFTDVDGQRGLLLYVGLAPRMSAWDGRDLLAFAAAVREVRLPNGEVIRGSGHPVIFADMLAAVLSDGPRAALLAFLGVVVLVVLSFRRLAPTVLTLGALCLGVAWLLGAMGGWDLLVRKLAAAGGEPLSERFVNAIPKINFLNFIVLPLTIGIGVDYAVNVLQRYEQEGVGSMRRVLESTGGAVVLCSLTTVIGYSALLLSDNLALVSFGKLANLGEIFCITAALAVLPSAVIVAERVRARRRAVAAQEGVP